MIANEDYTALRRRAEARLSGAEVEAPPEPQDLSRLVHELRVQHVELELQNEELRHAQLALAQARDRYFDLFDLAPVAYLTLDGAGMIIEGNLAAATLLGVDRGRLRRHSLTSFAPGADGGRLGWTLANMPEGRPVSLEVELRPRGAAPRLVIIDAMGARRDGRPIVRATLRDLTELRRAEAELRDREARLQAVLQTIADGVILVTDDVLIESFSASAERIFGYDAAEARGRGFEILVPGAERAACRARLQRLLRPETPPAPGASETLELVGQRRDGGAFPLELAVARHCGGEPRLVCVARDMSERVRREEALRHAQKMESLGALASGIAHDFNNLLMGVSASAMLALHRLPADHGAAPPLQRCLDAIQRGASITGQLLRFSARRPSRVELVEVDVLLGVTAALLRPLLGEHVRLEVRPGAPGARVLGDPGEIEQVLLNLGTNARDAMPRGGTLLVRTERSEGPAQAPGVAIRVRDSGQGMDEETRARLFEPFYTTKGPGRGTGLGLSMTQDIVTRLGGAISVESEPGQGAVFTVWLPLSQRPERRVAPAAHGQGRRVLVVEDDALVRDAVRLHLEALDYVPLVAEGPAEALALFGDCGGDVAAAILDVLMPGRLGGDLARELRTLRPALPVLLMSAQPADDLAQEGRLDPAAPLLSKPFDAETLGAALQRLLEVPAAGA